MSSKYLVEGPWGPYTAHTICLLIVTSLSRSVALATMTNIRPESSCEIQIASSLNHPNMVRILDAGEYDGEPYIVMEHLGNSETLKKWCNHEKVLSAEKVAAIIYKCARTLDYAHRRGVIHCDIKPSNIMLTGEGGTKIGDFGIAKWAFTGLNTLGLETMGSPLYMSPEQARGEEVTHQTDLYSLGVVMYELLAGNPPFQARDLVDLIDQICNEDPPPIADVRRDLPEGIQTIIDCSLAKNTVARYQTGGEMASDLAALFSKLDLSQSDFSDDEKFLVLRELEFFEEFSNAEILEVVKTCIWKSFSPGDLIVMEGDLDLCFYIVTAGDVSVIKQNVELCTIERGECFGEMGYLSKSLRSASVIARDEVSLLKISGTLMTQASADCQLRFSRSFLRTLIERLTRVSNEVAVMKLPKAVGA